MATNRSGWRHVIRKGTEAYENARQSSQRVNLAAMKAKTITADRPTECPEYSRLYATDFVLRSGMRVHNKQSVRLDFIDHDSQPSIYLSI